MYPSSIDAYKQQAVSTAPPAQLVLMCYDGVLAAITRARQGDIETRNRELQRAQAILTELSSTLDHDRGGQIAGSLASLYAFCIERLITANVRADLGLLDDVTTIVTDLREAWEQACCGALAVS